MNKDTFAPGIELLKQPALPLVSMIRFFMMTGPFATVAEVIDELPETIETGYALYRDPARLCNQYQEQLKDFELLKTGSLSVPQMVTEQGEPVDTATAGAHWILQQILTAELEKINSALCGPCNCTLCCVGPENSMAQDFFEIPLKDNEPDLFSCERCDSEESRQCRSTDDTPLFHDEVPFFFAMEPRLFHWQNGWSLILPKNTSCPNLAAPSGHCTVYPERPTVCRRPQIFPYIIEPLERENESEPLYRVRNSLLAITDCPYVTVLKDDIAAYAAACELELVLSRNKQ